MNLATFADVQAYVDAELAKASATVAAPTAIDVCTAWKRARPVVMFLMPFLPSGWKAVVQPVMTALDTFCPATP